MIICIMVHHRILFYYATIPMSDNYVFFERLMDGFTSAVRQVMCCFTICNHIRFIIPHSGFRQLFTRDLLDS